MYVGVKRDGNWIVEVTNLKETISIFDEFNLEKVSWREGAEGWNVYVTDARDEMKLYYYGMRPQSMRTLYNYFVDCKISQFKVQCCDRCGDYLHVKHGHHDGTGLLCIRCSTSECNCNVMRWDRDKWDLDSIDGPSFNFEEIKKAWMRMRAERDKK